MGGHAFSPFRVAREKIPERVFMLPRVSRQRFPRREFREAFSVFHRVAFLSESEFVEPVCILPVFYIIKCFCNETKV
jgi:hypothetical protein